MPFVAVHQQEDERVRLLWGPRGVSLGAGRGDVVVVVDVLSFATSCAIGAAQGAIIYPSRKGREGRRRASEIGAELAVSREVHRRMGGICLSPSCFEEIAPGTRVVLPSPNGSTCVREGEGASRILVAGLVNAQATATAALETCRQRGVGVTLVPCGERWGDEGKDQLRVAVEDLIGAGAVLEAFSQMAPEIRLSCESEVARASFRSFRGDLQEVLHRCGSGRELIERGFPQDVQIAARLDAVPVVVELRGDGSLGPP